MGQSPRLHFFYALTLTLLLSRCGGCDRPSNPPSTLTPPPSTTRPITVASLSPAATEILIGMGAGDRLVAVSNFDPARDATRNLPRVGDYLTTDWERLATLRPNLMVTQFAADRLPAGLIEKASGLNIKLINVPITRLDDIERAAVILGEAIGQAASGSAARQALESRIASVRDKSAWRKVRTLIVVDEAAHGVVGRDNYLNDVLEAAGGENVIRPPSAPYPSIDREQLLDLDPEVIFQLLPDASPQVIGAARQVWAGLTQLQAVRNGRVQILTQTFALQPSQHAADLADTIAIVLGDVRKTTSRPTSPASSPTSALSTGAP
jgi:ABC-type Fe3+-hydroxamate transport system substrate-binding protein